MIAREKWDTIDSMVDSLQWLSSVFAKLDTASWLQAFAAIVALGISVWATWRVGAADRKRDRLQASGIASAIYPELLKLRITVDYIQKGLAQFKTTAGHLAGQSIAADIERLAQIPIPPMIDRNIDRLFMLGGSAGPSCLQLVGGLFQYNNLVEQFTNGMMSMNAAEWTSRMPDLEKSVSLVGDAIEQCEREVRPIHDRIKR